MLDLVILILKVMRKSVGKEGGAYFTFLKPLTDLFLEKGEPLF